MSQQFEDVITDISKLSDEELIANIQKIRMSRGVRKETSSKAKDRPAKKSKGKDSALSLIAGMSDEERSKLLAKLTGE